MPLFVAVHRHPEERCPASDPKMAPMLLTHLSRENASSNGITIEAEAVANSAHTLYLIVDAPDQERVEKFMTPFAQAGSVDVFPASSCEAVVNRGGCGAALA
jgi:hypothetical protein